MIAKILASSASFPAVSYNTNKMEKDKGELMKVANFGPLQVFDRLRPEDYVNYLQVLSSLNKRVTQPQFHATISCNGREYDKHTLTEVAGRWMTEMGYGLQPYLVVFHKDTGNNHVHVVSTRIGRDGKKIDSSFEHNRAVQNIQKVMGQDVRFSAKSDVEKALAYTFSTKAQFQLLLESQGYVLREKEGLLEVIKFGKQLEEIALASILKKCSTYETDTRRQAQLKALFEKYSKVYDTALRPQTTPLPGGFNKATGTYTSAFAAFFRAKMGIELFFHASDNKQPYGYTIIDNAGKAVWKGSDIIPLKKLLCQNGAEQFLPNTISEEIAVSVTGEVKPSVREYYSALVKASLYNYPSLEEGLRQQGLEVAVKDNDFILTDNPAGIALPLGALLSQGEMTDFEAGRGSGNYRSHIPAVSISNDIDDEQINGRNRRRKRKARTNTR